VTYDGKKLQPNGDVEIIKQLNNGHALCHLKRKRVRGFCVKCIKKLGSATNYKKQLDKIVTYCPSCPGVRTLKILKLSINLNIFKNLLQGPWFCTSCFDDSHQ
jgi:hypothetical protein